MASVKPWKRQSLKLKARIVEVFGDQCVICGSNSYLVLHNINFERHNARYDGRANWRHYLKHQDEFVRLCYYCHRLVHTLEMFPDFEALLPYYLSSELVSGKARSPASSFQITVI